MQLETKAAIVVQNLDSLLWDQPVQVGEAVWQLHPLLLMLPILMLLRKPQMQTPLLHGAVQGSLGALPSEPV